MVNKIKPPSFLKTVVVLLAGLFLYGYLTGGDIQAQANQYPATRKGTIDSSNSSDRWTFEGAASRSMSIDAYRTSGNLDPKLWLLDQNGDVLATNDDYGGSLDAHILLLLPYTGEYTVVVAGSEEDENQTSGDYELEVDQFLGFTHGGGFGTNVYLSSTISGSEDTVAFDDEDILEFNTNIQSWSMYFNGSDVGLGGPNLDLDAFAIISDTFGEWEDDLILLSVSRSVELPDVGWVDDSDVILFAPDRLGTTTAGTFSLILDGSDVDLSSWQEDIDAISYAEHDGLFWLVLSTRSKFDVDGITGESQDLLIFDPESVGADSKGRWKLYFDGSDVNLNSGTENISGLTIYSSLRTGDINYFTTSGNFEISDLAGDGNDIFSCSPDSLNSQTSCKFSNVKTLSGSANGLTGGYVDGIQVEKP